MHHVDVTDDIYDAYRAWAGSRDTPPPLTPFLVPIPFLIPNGTQVFVGNIRLGNTTADSQFIYNWSDNTTQTLDVTTLGGTNRTFLPTLRYNEI